MGGEYPERVVRRWVGTGNSCREPGGEGTRCEATIDTRVPTCLPRQEEGGAKKLCRAATSAKGNPGAVPIQRQATVCLCRRFNPSAESSLNKATERDQSRWS